MSDLSERLTHLSPEQRRLLEKRLRERGIENAVAPSVRAPGQAPAAAVEDPSA